MDDDEHVVVVVVVCVYVSVRRSLECYRSRLLFGKLGVCQLPASTTPEKRMKYFRLRCLLCCAALFDALRFKKKRRERLKKKNNSKKMRISPVPMKNLFH